MYGKQEKRILKQVALTEKRIPTSFGEASFLPQEHFEPEVNVK